MSGFEVDPTALRAASPKFSTTGDNLRDAFNTLKSVLDAEGACWGGDDGGTSFAEGYLPAADSALQAFGVLIPAVHSIRTGLDESANAWEQVDQSGADAFGGQG